MWPATRNFVARENDLKCDPYCEFDGLESQTGFLLFGKIWKFGEKCFVRIDLPKKVKDLHLNLEGALPLSTASIICAQKYKDY